MQTKLLSNVRYGVVPRPAAIGDVALLVLCLKLGGFLTGSSCGLLNS